MSDASEGPFYELLWQGEVVSDAADLPEALEAFQALKPKHLSWEQICADPAVAPTIRRYRSFDAFLDNEDAVETIHPTAEMLEQAASTAADPDPSGDGG